MPNNQTGDGQAWGYPALAIIVENLLVRTKAHDPTYNALDFSYCASAQVMNSAVDNNLSFTNSGSSFIHFTTNEPTKLMEVTPAGQAYRLPMRSARSRCPRQITTWGRF